MLESLVPLGIDNGMAQPPAYIYLPKLTPPQPYFKSSGIYSSDYHFSSEDANQDRSNMPDRLKEVSSQGVEGGKSL